MINQISMQKESPLRLHRFDQVHTWLALLNLLLIQISPSVTAQPVTPTVDPDSNKSAATIMAIVAVMFLISGLLSLFSRKCTDRQAQTQARLDLTLPTGGSGNRSRTEPNGLNQEIIDTFPTFLYSDVKGLKTGKDTLACAVCLNEFQDDETLRMLPKCCHVYHVVCIDAWLASHSTCPVCRANLVPTPEDNDVNININMIAPPTLSMHDHEHEHETLVEDHKRDNDNDVDFLRRIRAMNQCRPSRSRSTGFLSSLLFPRSNSMGQLVLPGENLERFTLRLPDEVRSQMVNSTLKRANSCVCFTRMRSGTWSYRTRSVGSGLGRGHVHYERFGNEEQCGFPLTQPGRLVNNGWNRSARRSPVQCSLGVPLDNNVGERYSDFFRLG
ncbi:RING-H2 finger protein ATL34-like [Abrus precatorius]|uniref:RING-type E3 ubiquitin transferase n=1 Tax=Abrus precatorius TaxID=3816 RepID=A0A8B8MME1_ABRPR|nr:RING-H2 finger protein ATL34-like [Abrus precatorius]